MFFRLVFFTEVDIYVYLSLHRKSLIDAGLMLLLLKSYICSEEVQLVL